MVWMMVWLVREENGRWLLRTLLGKAQNIFTHLFPFLLYPRKGYSALVIYVPYERKFFILTQILIYYAAIVRVYYGYSGIFVLINLSISSDFSLFPFLHLLAKFKITCKKLGDAFKIIDFLWKMALYIIYHYRRIQV